MDYGHAAVRIVDADRVFLDLENPRHEPFEDQDAVIQYLCREERVLPLAKDIVEHGLNPIELFAVIPDGHDAYFAAEGNRRLCALKLLNDPDLAPPDLRNDFERAAQAWAPIAQLTVIEFANRGEVRLWLDRTHAGFADGRGRRQWNAEQKARNSGYSKNHLAQVILDAGQEHDFITVGERKGRLSTVQRYLSNPVMRNVLGLDASDLANLKTDLATEDFDSVFRRFMGDVAGKKITTRDNSEEITAYANALRNLSGLTGERVEKRPIALPPEPARKTDSSSRPNRPKKPTKLALSEELLGALQDIPSYKLEKLYYSLCTLRIADHTPLLSVGVWCFLETLTAVAGRQARTDFQAFLNPTKLEKLGVGDARSTKAMREAVKRVSEFGNSTKHHKTSAAFNGEQLANDMETMGPMLVAVARAAKGKR